YENERQRKVYLPDGKWRNIHDNKEYQGGQEINVNAPIDEIPVFVREGSLEEIC
ncbi:hypothetical protein, partial [Robinsoniella sp. RHS]